MQILKALSCLLEYPDELLWEHGHELQPLLAQGAPELAARLPHWLARPLMDQQVEWGETFERGRATSLLLFEHVHGESRDRGQAMVDLLSQYGAADLALDRRELPDYLPLYLEYLSCRPEPEAREGLVNIAPILALIGGRLAERESEYALIFDALLALSGSPLRSHSVGRQVAGETRDDTPQALDAVWEEEQVRFIDDNATACDSSPQQHYQRRFSQDVAPQYLDIAAGGPK
ncbi:nitrate reductase molybdenum cofactor assembly chaperone [Shimwellia blattae]|uniref:Nitrate reductase molybdenum cofactor assembly chaperone 2 n=1 Tax=Shimwellia blattae (strain ATCC 29907 / DSM 4481 / JCM 1650 / NBRC 105725 / CDC 9005-74) TaxID=630626 RepID=I2B982_SHIBC|nr:nitrate reductase molybdenum cofactor assembly chaperone [Shimwellia blattae]AFJ47086.1 nitrate reductase molybdenum cofactor assembly chaperone 2 [Shimwellia blattae DSM 4481 = NBRC 105725]GAB80792.1 putative nitrate reductase II molybdenum cofactor assembly chaperone NarW [Shimwellia blattae DSM 4481 = NBRC 105725]VDY64579.1 Redox enzyme maturation protein NarJ [Shimwellia blattae]VEC22687.1 Redox enzyme maturation protein NarJ [Shimwellia blattae]